MTNNGKGDSYVSIIKPEYEMRVQQSTYKLIKKKNNRIAALP